MPLFNITSAMLKQYPYHMRELIRVERAKQERELLKDRKELVSHIGKWVAACMGIVFMIIWAVHL